MSNSPTGYTASQADLARYEAERLLNMTRNHPKAQYTRSPRENTVAMAEVLIALLDELEAR